jgi:hypothetical protein
MRSHDESLIWKTLLESDEQIALPGMNLPDARQQRINILSNRFIEGLKNFYPDNITMTRELIRALENSSMVKFNKETDLHLVEDIINRRMR